MYDTDEEEAQRGRQLRLRPSRETNRGHDLLSASQWSPISTVVGGRTTQVDTVPTGHGRPRGDAGACYVDDFMTCRPAAPWPGSVGAVQPSTEGGGGRPVICLLFLFSNSVTESLAIV